VVVGLGKTGTALVTFLLNQGAQVAVSDSRDLSDLAQALSPFKERGFLLDLEGGGGMGSLFSSRRIWSWSARGFPWIFRP
jgi:predicted dinucleotide-binding enzyme